MRRSLRYVGVGVTGALALGAIGAILHLRSSLPQVEGVAVVPGLRGEVEVLRDSYGMPHVFARDDHDAAFALGYSAAQDRMFQMDLVRRAIRGKLSEVLGAEMLDADKLLLTITAQKSLEELYAGWSPEVTSTMEAYAAGVNAYLARQGTLPLEFTLLGYRPEPWQPSDCAAAYYYMAWDMNSSFQVEPLRHAIVSKVGQELAGELFPGYPKGRGTIIPSGPTGKGFLARVEAARRALGASDVGNSNNWVVGGVKSATGQPLLANDMHLGHGLPGIWYEAHVQTPSLNVSGVLAPGIPFVVVGANEHVAWGFTNVMADDSDYYLERVNPADSRQVEFQGAWETMRVKRHRIVVKDAAAVDFEIRLTRHGPVVDEVNDFDEPAGFVVSMRWTAPELANVPQALYLFSHAKSADDLERAFEHFKCPGQNVVYADTQGNIGMWAAVGIPVREGFSGAELLPGWDGKHEWKGYVPTDQQPHLRNPAEGWIATANNKHVDDAYPYTISNAYAGPERHERIVELLTSKDRLSVEDFKRMHSDSTVVLAREWAPPLLKALASAKLDGPETQAQSVLETWDYEAPADAAAPLVFHAFVNALVRNVFLPRLGDRFFRLYSSERWTAFSSLRGLFGRPSSAWWDDPSTQAREQAADVLVASFRQGVAEVAGKLGADVAKWKWGELHTVTFRHPFGKASALLSRLFDRGPYPRGGSFDSVNPMPYSLSKPWDVRHGASMRYVFDLGDPRRSLRVIPSGISGNFMSPHYDDQIDLWLRGDYRPFRLDRAGVEADARHRLQLRLQ